MKRFFTKKSVAYIFATILLFGFLSFNFVRAQTNTTQGNGSQPTTVIYTQTGLAADGWYYVGNGYWHKMPIVPGASGNISTADMQSKYTLPDSYVSRAEAFDGLNNAYMVETGAYNGSVLGNLFSNMKGDLANYVAGLASLPSFIVLSALLKILQLILSFFLAAISLLFDSSISFSIIHIKDLFSNPGLNTIWTMTRDILNISFIFILLWMAITKIIGGWGAQAKATLTNLILSVVFINFSMFITKILIDASNLVTVEIYKNVLSVISKTGGTGLSVTGFILKSFGFTSMMGDVASMTGQTNILVMLVLQIIIISVLGYVFAFGCFILIGRAVMLVFLAITSPIGFIGSTVPGLGEYSGKWWKSLNDQLLVAPMLMFVLLLVITLMQSGSSIINISSPGTPPPLNVGGLLYYFVMIMILIKGMGIVTKLSGEVAGMAVKAVATLAVGAAAVATGGVAAYGLVGGIGSTAAAASGGAKGLAGLRNRLAFGAKEIGKASSNFVTGKYDKTGVGGLAQGFIRDKAIGGLKSATGGNVDVKAIEKALEKTRKEADKNLMEKGDSFVKKNRDREKELNSIKDNIEQQAKSRLKDDSTKQKEAEKELETLGQKKKTAETALKTADANKNPQAYNQAKEELGKVTSDFSFAEKKVEDFKKNFEDKLKTESEKVANEMGTSLEDITKEQEEISGKIVEGLGKRNEFIKGISEKGFVTGKLSTLLWGGDRKKLVEKLRAQKGNYDPKDKKQIEKAVKELFGTSEEEPKKEEKKEESKPEEKK